LHNEWKETLMAIAVFSQWPAAPAGTADRITELINQRLGDRPPVGGRYHAEGPTADGGWWTFNVWDSADDRQRFADEVLGPVLAQVGAPQGQAQQLEVAWDTSQMPGQA
jgi:hypothetical protein